MAESVLKDIYPLFEENSTKISRKNLALLHSKTKQEESKINSEVLDIVLAELDGKQSLKRVDLLKTILYKSQDEEVKKATIQELVRLKTTELSEILSGYLKSNRVNTPSKVEAIRALGKVAIRRYLNRK